jgi:hypothetical protein
MARIAGHVCIGLTFNRLSRRHSGREQEQQGADWPNYKRSFMRHALAADPDEGRTRGTHSLAGKSCAALDLIGHSPRRSKPVVINACRHAAVELVSLSSVVDCRSGM